MSFIYPKGQCLGDIEANEPRRGWECTLAYIFTRIFVIPLIQYLAEKVKYRNNRHIDGYLFKTKDTSKYTSKPSQGGGKS